MYPRALLLTIAAVALLAGAPAGAVQKYQQGWKVAAAGAWPPAVVGQRVVVKSGDTLTAYQLSDGGRIWQRSLPGLLYGEGVLAAGGQHVYVLDGKGVHLLGAADGQPIKHHKLGRPINVLYHKDTVYVTTAGGSYRFGPALEKKLGEARGVTGEIRGADGQYLVLYQQQVKTKGGSSPKRLVVLDLNSSKLSYTFKLLPRGGHRVIRVGSRRLVFIDYSRRYKGQNKRKLFYTEADYARAKKTLKDISLSGKYTAAESDRFWVAAGAAGQVFVANHGKPGAPTSLLAYDPARRSTIWARGGLVASMGILLHRGQLWTGTVDDKGRAMLVVYSPDNGNLLFRRPLDSPGAGSPVGIGDGVLVRTTKSIYCLVPAGSGRPAPAPAGTPPIPGTTTAGVTPGVTPLVPSSSAAVPAPGATPTPSAAPTPAATEPVSRAGWWTHTDKIARFTVQLPRRWHLDHPKVMRLGGVRSVVPFALTRRYGSRVVYLASIQVLTWEAAGRSADGQWQSVYAQRKTQSPDLRVLKVKRVRIGPDGHKGIFARYTFRGPNGYQVELRSLCLVKGRVAYELRAWAGPMRTSSLWEQIEEIGQTFRATPR